MLYIIETTFKYVINVKNNLTLITTLREDAHGFAVVICRWRWRKSAAVNAKAKFYFVVYYRIIYGIF